MALPRIGRSSSPSTSSASLHSTAIMMARASRGSISCSAAADAEVAGSAPSPGSATKTPSSSAQPWTVMRFSVSVPVLSTQTTVVAPRLSITSRRRTRAWRCSMRCMPRASVVVATAGRPSGTAATPRAIVVRAISRKATPRSRPRPSATPHSAVVTPTSVRPIWARCVSRGVDGAAACGDQRADLSDLRAAARLGDHGQAGPLAHHGSREDHVGAIRQRGAVGVHDPRALGHGHALPGQQRLVHEQPVGVVEEAPIGGHLVAGPEQDDVARNQRGRRDEARRARRAGPAPWGRPCAGAR